MYQHRKLCKFGLKMVVGPSNFQTFKQNLYLTFSVKNMAEKQRKGSLQLIISCISNHF